jgi:glycosyltransferase involved in cell wall biosynthesis
MKFSIITPTYKRSEKLERAVASLCAQTYSDWELIIVNDSPKDDTYRHFSSTINDPRIHYYENDTNRGVNYSRNRGLDKVSADSKWIIFLDDDDYFAPDTLATFVQLIVSNNNKRWFITNRALQNGEPTTIAPHSQTVYSYAWSYLIFKKIKGDATHCIETKLITRIQARFSKYVKQGEEWFFFFQIGQHESIYYYDHNSTITEGYDELHGLNFRKRSKTERFETITTLSYEGFKKQLFFSFAFIFYIVARYGKLLFSFK